VWDSAAFSSIFLASGFLCSQAESTPAHTQVTQTVSLPFAKQGKLDIEGAIAYYWYKRHQFN